METAYDKECNRRPGNSRCVKSVKGNGCTALVERSNGGFKVACKSCQKSTGRIPVELLIIKKGLCCGKEGVLLLSRNDGKLFCTYCFNEYCPDCGKLIKENLHSCYLTKDTTNRKYPERLISY